MSVVKSRGVTTAPIWLVFETPYTSDEAAGRILTGNMGYTYTKMFKESGLDLDACFICAFKPEPSGAGDDINRIEQLNNSKPPLVLAIGDAAGRFLPELRERGNTAELSSSKGQLAKYAGSLLSSSFLSYPHYCVPLYGPERCVQDWQERNITTYIDLQKIKDELEYWKTHAVLKQLPTRTLKYGDMDMDELLMYFERFRNAKVLSDDIENPVYNVKEYSPHPGYPFLIGLADSPDFGISFKLFRDKPSENRELWRRLDKLLYEVPVLLGQNFFNYDAMFHEALGFRINLERVQDTLIRHHILWPELSHKLQFLTRQYTREPYYKDENAGWTLRNLDRYRRYNALDAAVTMEVYLGQETEFKARPHLR